jgi:hypothetical protein
MHILPFASSQAFFLLYPLPKAWYCCSCGCSARGPLRSTTADVVCASASPAQERPVRLTPARLCNGAHAIFAGEMVIVHTRARFGCGDIKVTRPLIETESDVFSLFCKTGKATVMNLVPIVPTTAHSLLSLSHSSHLSTVPEANANSRSVAPTGNSKGGVAGDSNRRGAVPQRARPWRRIRRRLLQGDSRTFNYFCCTSLNV